MKHEGKSFDVSLRLDAHTYLMPEGGSHEDKYIHTRGTTIVGPAWTIFDENGRECEPRPESPSIDIVVEFTPNNGSYEQSAVTEEDMNAVLAMRAYLESKL